MPDRTGGKPNNEWAFTQAYELIIGQFKQQTLEEIGTEFLNNPPHN